MTQTPPTPPEQQEPAIEGLVAKLRRGAISRRGFVVALTALGASTTAVTTLLAAVQQPVKPQAEPHVQPAPEQANLILHEQHLTRQNSAPPPSHPDHAAHMARVVADYDAAAVVDDMLAGVPVTGHAAIAARKAQTLASMRDLAITVTNRYAAGDQVVAEWVATGTHHQDFLGLKASGKSFSIRGLTVVSRSAGKIVRESLYYDLSEVRSQLS